MKVLADCSTFMLRDVSLQTITKERTKASDTFMTIVQTAKKLGVNAYQYICDRVPNKFKMPSQAQLIRKKIIEWKIPQFPLNLKRILTFLSFLFSPNFKTYYSSLKLILPLSLFFL